MNKITTLEELENFLISPVEVLWKKQNGKNVSILPIGGVVDVSSLKKFTNIEIESFFDYEAFEKLNSLFKQLKDKKPERDRIQVASEIILFLENDYWYGRNDVSLLTLVMSCSHTFFDRTNSFPVNLKLKSEILYQRALLLGTLNVIFLILIGHYSYSFLEEAFNIALYYEHEIISKHLDTNFIMELENARKGVYSSFFIESVVTDKKIDSLKWNFFNQMLAKHYEKIDASGAKGLCGDEMSDTERVLCSLHHALRIKSPSYSFDDGRGYLMGIVGNMKLDQKLESLISNNFNKKMAQGA